MSTGLCPVAVNARRCPERMALAWSGRSIAWDAFNNYVHSTSRYLKEISVRPQAPVLVVKEDSPAYVIVLLALWRIGAVPCPVDVQTLRDKAEALNAAVKPCLVIGARGIRKITANRMRSADIEQVVAYGYNDSFLGSEASLDPKVDSDHPALLRLRISGGVVEADSLTHEQLKKDPGDMGPLFHALTTGETYKI